MIGPFPRAIMYHYVRDVDTQPAVGYPALSPAAFDAQLDGICRMGTPVGWEDLVAALQDRRALPADAVILTFDDGLADHSRAVLPRLVARGLTGIFFALARTPSDGLTVGHKLHLLLASMTPQELGAAVADRLPGPARAKYLNLVADYGAPPHSDPADPWKRPLQRELERHAAPILAELVRERLGPEDELAAALHLSEGQLDELRANGMTIGGHGRDHRWLDHVGSAVRRAEVIASAGLVARFGDPPWPFAYPYGGVPPRPRSLLEPSGFAAAFASQLTASPDRYRIGRHDADGAAFDPTRL